jgi:hypothetical protein
LLIVNKFSARRKSGKDAAINKSVLKIKAKEIAQKTTWLNITGNYKRFEVIPEL